MKAVIIGSTGLVGHEILKLLIADSRITSIKSFSRQAVDLQHPKLSQRLVSFEDMPSWNHEIESDVAFSSLGTTRSIAGGIAQQYKVDFTYQANFAKECRNHNVNRYVLISSIGADPQSKIPYLKMKGELEEYVMSLGISHVNILRPGPLVGSRNHRRYAEEVMLPFNRFLSKLPGLSDLEPVSAHKVALCALRVAMSNSKQVLVSPQEIRETN
jgi:uncharacterized protein YbjT (DUF2867 family)